MYEFEKTIKTLWKTVKGIDLINSSFDSISGFFFAEFTKKHPEYVQKNNSMGFMSVNGGETYNLCHCECLFRFLVVIADSRLGLY